MKDIPFWHPLLPGTVAAESIAASLEHLMV
jgi:hypothetical protein